MFYFTFWLIAAVICIALIAGGTHKKVDKKVSEFIDNNFKDEKENV